MRYSVYILECSDGSYYVGMSGDLDTRVRDHQAGKSRHTARRLPVVLRFQEVLSTKAEAEQRERQIKKWSRAKKTALIEANFVKLHDLSRCRVLYPVNSTDE